ncbi:MAG TPA: metallophosphoesterase [Thermoanaerobaculia bacterium]|nr:metallophosphoesterase [Thermoanaerobaculia bacterium]
MKHHWCRAAFALVLFAVLPLRAKDGPPPRDWKACPAVVEFDTKRTVYALGDIHADYDRAVKLLIAGSLMSDFPDKPTKARWTGGKSVLVVTGDLIDKWSQSIEVIELLRALRDSAEEAGGRVIVSAGNHEAEFLADPQNSKAKDFRKELDARDISPESVADGTDRLGLGEYMLCLPFAMRINDWFFSHAGNSDGRTLAKLAKKIESEVDEDGYDANVLLGNDGLLESRMKPPWWEREDDTPEESIERLQSYADELGVQHIVFGHQPGTYEFNDGSERKKGTMFQNFDGLVFLIDVGMSHGVDDSKGSLLQIEGEGDDQTATALYRDQKPRQLWPAKGAKAHHRVMKKAMF